MSGDCLETRIKDIKNIAKEIEDFTLERKEEAWFFWSENKVKGKSIHKAGSYTPIRWTPDSKPVMFVAPHPSTGKYTNVKGKDKLRMFLDSLVRHNFANELNRVEGNNRVYFEGCFVTDLVKIRLRGKEGKEHLREFHSSEWEAYLRRELEIVNPLLLVALGSETYDTLVGMKDLDRPVERIYHYGSLRFPTRAPLFKAQIARISRIYHFLSQHSHTRATF